MPSAMPPAATRRDRRGGDGMPPRHDPRRRLRAAPCSRAGEGPEGLAVIGKPIPKADAGEKVIGRSEYIHDFALPGMLFGKILYSTRPHAQDRLHRHHGSREVSRSQGGVHRPQHARDPLRPAQRQHGAQEGPGALLPGRGGGRRGHHPARSPRRPLKLIKVEYEDLPAVFDPEEALAEGAPLIHEKTPRASPSPTTACACPGSSPPATSRRGKRLPLIIVEGYVRDGLGDPLLHGHRRLRGHLRHRART